MYHIDFEPHEQVQKAMAAPVTEIATFYFDDEPPDGYVGRCQDFLGAARSSEEEGGARPVACAVGVTHEKIEFEDVRGNAVVLMVGWESLEGHRALRDRRVYEEYMPELGIGGGVQHVHHVALRKV
jgi:hypothetical protein